MKSLEQFMQEKLILKNCKNTNSYKYFPKTKKELIDIINKRIKSEGNEVDLNDIDVSQITNMSNLFRNLDFNGDISNWNVSNVVDMSFMFFSCSLFNQDISNWNVSNITDMRGMFYECSSFNQDISSWDVSNVSDMSYMFYNCKSFNQNISSWNVLNVADMHYMFTGCKHFNQDISDWDVSNVKDFDDMFNDCKIEEKHKPIFK